MRQSPFHPVRTKLRNLFSSALLLGWFVLSAGSARGQELTVDLASSDVECQTARLAAMLDRIRITGSGPVGPQEDGIPWAVFLSPGRAERSFVGLGLSTAAVNNPNLIRPQPDPLERQIGFHMEVEPEQLLLDPARPKLPQVTLVREEPATNLVEATSEFRLSISLDTSLAGNLGPLATINNFVVSQVGRTYNGFRASSAQPGRGLLVATTPVCGGNLTPQDHRVLAILRRMLRITVEDLDDGCDLCAFHSSHEIALYRGGGGHEYLFDVYPYRHSGTRLGRLSGKMTVNWDGAGKLTTGTLEVFPRCTVGQSRFCSDTPVDLYVFVWPPGTAAVVNSPDGLGSVSLHYVAAIGQADPVAIPFATFLSQSYWN